METLLANIHVVGSTVRVNKANAATSGMVGAVVSFTFGPPWDSLAKTAVFKAGSVVRDVVGFDKVVTVPHEVLETPGRLLMVGVYGTNADGSLAIPTVFGSIGNIEAGADPSGDPSTAPELPVWAAMQGQLDKLGRDVQELRDRPSVEIPPEAVEDAVNEYLELNPPAQGAPGRDGKTPVKGLDYFTSSDVQEIADQAAALVKVPDTYTRQEIDAIMGAYITDIDALVGGGS